MIRFRFLSGDADPLGYGGKWVSNCFRESDHPAWFVIELSNLVDACGEREAKEIGGRYCVTLSVVMPGMVPADEWEAAKRSCGWEVDDKTAASDLYRVEVLHSYGTRATSGEWVGNNAHKLLKLARAEARLENSFTFGFAMDKAQNRIGATGWDCLAGNPWGALRGATMKEVVESAVKREGGEDES